MKLRPETKIEKRNKTTLKKFDDDAMSANYDVIVIFLIYGQFAAIRKPDFGRIVCKTYIFIKSNTAFTLLLRAKVLFFTKLLLFCKKKKKKKMLTSAKLREPSY